VTGGEDFDGCVLTRAAAAEAGMRQRQSVRRRRAAQANEENESRKGREAHYINHITARRILDS